MSNILARIYDDMKDVTKSDSVNDPQGPFASLLVTVAGTLKITTRQDTTIALAAVAVGQVIEVPVKRVWSSSCTATVVGYVSAAGGMPGFA